MKKISPRIVCAYLFTITKYGYPPPASNTEKHLEEIAALGFQSVELEGIREEHLLSIYERRQLIRKALQQYHIKVPVFCTVLPGLSSLDADERQDQLRLFEIGCETAVHLGADLVLDNGPLPPYHFEDSIPVTRHYEHQILSRATMPPDFNWTSFWNQLIETFQLVCDIAKSFGLSYLVHPAIGVLGATPEAFLYLAQAINRPNFGFCFDTSNLLTLKSNLILSLHQLGPLIKYIHVSDNRGNKNEHLEPGQGIIDWTTFFQELSKINYNGPIGIDIGGAESDVKDLEQAYVNTASMLEKIIS